MDLRQEAAGERARSVPDSSTRDVRVLGAAWLTLTYRHAAPSYLARSID
ncbi:hypothetical protein AB0J38_37715 [Streptomyces sp. NPDC050095]